MREILFRGKRLANGKWVYGGFHSRFQRSFIIGMSQSMRIDGTEVIPETVGQYTGLTDKNGKKIFEGDIVTSQYYLKNGTNKNSIIEYGEWNCSCCNGVYGWVSNGFVDFRDDDVIIIGNIHDNPELLKGGANNDRTAKAEAYKEFAESLKAKADDKLPYDNSVDVVDIDNLLKEMESGHL